jgi:excisionase family DNA binding protein
LLRTEEERRVRETHRGVIWKISFNVNAKTIYRRLWAKGIPAYRVGRTWRIARKDIIWLRQ